MGLQQEPLKVAVVGGSGLIGKRHCHHVALHPATQLIAIVDPSPVAVEVAKAHATALYPSISALLDSPHRPEAAIVCTPNHTHVPLATQLAQAGVHILCEKPLSTTIENGQSLIDTATEHNIKLLVGHHRRFNPYMLAAKRTLDSGVLGMITAVSGLWTTTKPPEYFSSEPLRWRSSKSSGGGVVLTNFVHEIDLMHYMFGPVTRIHAEKTIPRRAQGPDAAEEGAALTMRFASGVVGTFILSDHVASPHSFEHGTGENPMLPQSGADVYRIFGTKGTLSFPDMLLSTYGSNAPSWEQQLTQVNLEVPNREVLPFDSQLDHFAKVCRGTETPSCTGEEGLRALIVCDAVRRALDGRGGGGTMDIEEMTRPHDSDL